MPIFRPKMHKHLCAFVTKFYSRHHAYVSRVIVLVVILIRKNLFIIAFPILVHTAAHSVICRYIHINIY